MCLTLTPAMLDAIQGELVTLGSTKEIHISERNGATVTATADAGFGTYTFIVNRNGRTVQAGMGEDARNSVPV